MSGEIVTIARVQVGVAKELQHLFFVRIVDNEKPVALAMPQGTTHEAGDLPMADFSLESLFVHAQVKRGHLGKALQKLTLAVGLDPEDPARIPALALPRKLQSQLRLARATVVSDPGAFWS